MKNKYLENLSKIEFVVTYDCTGRCKHCSEGDHCHSGERISPSISADAVRKVAAKYDIKTLMTFGGEPLLYPDVVYAIMSVGKELDIQRRQVITNGCFSADPERIQRVAEMLSECGVNDLLLSVDAFHQETLSLKTVKLFAAELKKRNVPVRLSPAWLVSKEDNNPYNVKTREILDSFKELHIPEGSGNVIFPEGNAKKYLAEYFTSHSPENPYVEDREDVRCISFSPNGDVLDGNVYKTDITEILEKYLP